MSWNGSNSSLASPAGKGPAEGAAVRPHPSPSAPRTRRGLLAGIIIVALGSAALFFLTRSGNNAAPQEAASHKKGLIKDNGENVAKPVYKEEPKPASKPTRKPKPAFIGKKPRAEWTSAEQAIAYQWYAQDPKNIQKGIDMTTRVPPPTFSNLLQEAMAPYLNPGDDVLPIEHISDAQARKAIDTEIDFRFDDPDEVLEKKQGVKEMLADLKKFMDEGGHAQEYFLQLESRQKLECETMQEVRRSVREFEASGDYEGACSALEKYNAYLKDKGMPPVRMRIRKNKEK